MDRRSQPIRIVIADDHPIFRDGLRRLLEAEPGLKVIGEACDGAEAVKLARQLKPDILLLDLAMPRHPGLEALRDLGSNSAASMVRVILLTAAAEKNQIVEACNWARVAWFSRIQPPSSSEGHSHGDVGRVLGRSRERFEPGAVSAHAGSVLGRRGATEEIRFDPTRTRDRLGRRRRVFEQGNR